MNPLAPRRRAASVGMFDGVHLGHQQVVRQLCAVAGDRLMPSVFTFDRHPMSVVAPRRAPQLLTTCAQKSELLVQAGAEDVVVLVFDDYMRNLSASDFLSMLHHTYCVDRLVVGFNHHFGHDRSGTFADYRDIGLSMGIEMISAEEYVPAATEGHISSSAIRRQIADGDVAGAAGMLGHAYAIDGIVVHGRSLGSRIGYPTANLEPYMANQLIPKDGVYAAWATVSNGETLPAMVNVGTNPSVRAEGNPLTIEAHIIDYMGDLYNRPLRLEFVNRLRDERTFASMADLTAQLHRDRQAALDSL